MLHKSWSTLWSNLFYRAHPASRSFCWMCVVSVFLIPAGCGYRFTVQGPGPVIGGGPGLKQEGPPVRLAIQDLTNRSFEPNLELKYTEYLRNEFKSGSGADIVQDGKPADFLLKERSNPSSCLP